MSSISGTFSSCLIKNVLSSFLSRAPFHSFNMHHFPLPSSLRNIHFVRTLFTDHQFILLFITCFHLTSIFLLFLTWNPTLAKDPFLLLPLLSGTLFHLLFAHALLFQLLSQLKTYFFPPWTLSKAGLLHGFLNWCRFWPFSLAEIFDLIDFDGLDELNCFYLEGRPKAISQWRNGR